MSRQELLKFMERVATGNNLAITQGKELWLLPIPARFIPLIKTCGLRVFPGTGDVNPVMQMNSQDTAEWVRAVLMAVANE